MRRVPIPRRGPAITQQALNLLGEEFRAAFAQGDFMRALKFATQAWEATRSPQPLADVALCQMRLGRAMQVLIVGIIAVNESVGPVLFRRGLSRAGEIIDP